MEPKKRDEELPDGWVLCKSKSNPGRNYYFNTKTGKSSWTQPQDDDDSQKETCKKEKLVKKPDKRKIEEPAKKVTKRKSDGVEESASRKKTKNDSTDSSTSNICKGSTSINTSKASASCNTSTTSTFSKRSKTGNICDTSKSGNLSKTSIRESPKKSSIRESPKKTSIRESPRKNERVRKSDIPPQCTSTPKRISKGTPEKSSPSRTPKSAPSSAETSRRRAPIKNLANARLSQLRNTLNSEVQNQQEEASPAKNKISPKNDTLSRSKPERKSPLNESNTNQSPSDSLHSEIQSPSQFFAANKIISSMKAQLPEYCSKEKPKDTFAEIEEGICNQTPEYPFSKHPATPPQFSEASKLVSAIKSKLAYKVSSSKEVKPYPSANDRMQSLRARFSSESDREGTSFLNSSNELDPRIKHFEAMDVEESREVNHTIPTFPVQNESSSSIVVLVVDTNIFIHELDFIKNVLNSHIKGYSEQPTLLVPWRVINELDRLKDNNNGKGALCKRAKAAMDYLYKSLPENNRIKGQSLRDANSHIYPCEVPDDEILNCSLQQVERGKNVILLSNDKNLCNKASINGVKHIDVKELKKLVENKPQPSVDPDLLAGVKRCQRTVYNLLSNILENEMRAKYNNLWQRVLFKPPPWTLTDVLQCLLKHWIAVFNEVFPRIEQLITDLKNSLMTIENKNPNTLTQSEVANFKELCLDVAKRCQIIPEYMELAKATVDRLLRNGNEVDSTDAVVDAFEGLWTVFSSYCAKLSTELGVPHSIEDKLPGSEPLPVLTSKLTLFSGHVSNLTLAIKSILSTDSTESIDERVRRLECVFREALAAISANNVVAREELRAFCVNCRVMLEEAHNKFAHLAEVLDVCKSRLTSDSAMN